MPWWVLAQQADPISEAVSTMQTSLMSYIGQAASIAIPVGLVVVGLIVVWRLVKRFLPAR